MGGHLLAFYVDYLDFNTQGTWLMPFSGCFKLLLQQVTWYASERTSLAHYYKDETASTGSCGVCVVGERTSQHPWPGPAPYCRST